MNKILRNLALAAVVAAPCTAMAEIAGTGTAEDPYVIATAEDLCAANKLLGNGETGYFIQTADIDMTGITDYTPVTGYDSETYGIIYYDGQNHVIKNFAPSHDEFAAPYCYGQSIFGLLQGELKNLGIVDVTINAPKNGRAGAVAGYCGYGSVELTKVSNVYVTGKIVGSKDNYTGGLFGTTGAAVELNNCFVNVEMSSEGGDRNGLLAGRIHKTTTINNCYVAGTATGNVNLVCGENSATTTVNGLVVFATGATATGLTSETGVTMANTDATKEAGLTEVKGWAAYSSTETIDGYPAFKYALQGSGTEADPYLIATAQDLCAMWTYTGTHNSDTFYFKQTADIDMLEVDAEDWHPALGFDGKYDKLATIHYDGQNHIISNFMGANEINVALPEGDTQYYAGSLFGVFTGTIKNLGVVDANVQASKTLGVGVLGGYGSYAGESLVENVFVTGKVNGGASYCGGMFGTMAGNAEYQVTFLNCYVNAEIEGTVWAGGFMGRIDGPVALENCYAAGTVVKNDNSGLILGNKRDGKPYSADILNVIAFNTGAENAIPFAVGEGSEEVTVATEATEAELIEAVQGWDGYQDKLYKGYPALEWQTADLSGIRDIAIDAVEANGPAVYYNLQGVQVANPENGIYIVRRGNKVTKELVK